jgi:hypothetical protein
VISVQGDDLWTIRAYTDLVTWLHGQQIEAPHLAALIDGDPMTDVARSLLTAEITGLMARVSRDAPPWVTGSLTWARDVLINGIGSSDESDAEELDDAAFEQALRDEGFTEPDIAELMAALKELEKGGGT